MARTTFTEGRGPILEQLYRRACIRIGVLQCVSFAFIHATRMLLAVLVLRHPRCA